MGAAGCVLGGMLSRSVGSARTAALALATSGTRCAVYPLASTLGASLQLALLLVWGERGGRLAAVFSAVRAGVSGGQDRRGVDAAKQLWHFPFGLLDSLVDQRVSRARCACRLAALARPRFGSHCHGPAACEKAALVMRSISRRCVYRPVETFLFHSHTMTERLRKFALFMQRPLYYMVQRGSAREPA